MSLQSPLYVRLNEEPGRVQVTCGTSLYCIFCDDKHPPGEHTLRHSTSVSECCRDSFGCFCQLVHLVTLTAIYLLMLCCCFIALQLLQIMQMREHRWPLVLTLLRAIQLLSVLGMFIKMRCWAVRLQAQGFFYLPVKLLRLHVLPLVSYTCGSLLFCAVLAYNTSEKDAVGISSQLTSFAWATIALSAEALVVLLVISIYLGFLLKFHYKQTLPDVIQKYLVGIDLPDQACLRDDQPVTSAFSAQSSLVDVPLHIHAGGEGTLDGTARFPAVDHMSFRTVSDMRCLGSLLHHVLARNQWLVQKWRLEAEKVQRLETELRRTSVLPVV